MDSDTLYSGWLMSCVTFECRTCNAFWTKFIGEKNACPKCGAIDYQTDWDEAGDFSGIEFNDACEGFDAEELIEQDGQA